MDTPKLVIVLIFLLGLFLPADVQAQMERERVNPDQPVGETFWAPNIVGMATVEQLPANNLNVTIMHSFGIISNRTIPNFFGLDVPPNVRLGLDYGLTDNWSAGIGRTTFEKVVDLRTKLQLLRQTPSGDTPLSLSLKGDIAVTTQENLRPFADDVNFLVAVPLARKFNSAFSLQLSPMLAHFNSAEDLGGDINNLFGVGVGTEIHLSDRYALSAEYYPVFGDRPDGTRNAFALGMNIETGGHVFQLFFASSQWHTEQYIMSRNRDDFWAGDFRFGFNVNRVFFIGRK